MVLSRTIENLKERPKHEREAVAFWIAVAVVIVLILAWGVFFFRSLGSSLAPVGGAYSQAVQAVQTQQSEAAAQTPDDTGWVSSASQTSAAAASQEIQMIEEDQVPQAVDPLQ